MGKKFLSFALVVTLIASLFTGMMVAKAEVPAGYIVYEEFGAEAPSGWVALDYSADAPSTATFSTYEVGEGTGNYALKASSGNGTTYMGIKYLINGGEGIALADDKNIVIETKFSHMNTVPSQKTRLDFKVNMNATANGDRWIANAGEAVGNHYYSVLGILENSGVHSGPANRVSNAIVYDTASLGTTGENGWVSGMDAGNGWYTVKMEYKGKTGKADVTITDPYGKELKYTDIYAPFSGWGNSTAYVTETLKDIGFRSLSEGGRGAYDNIYVDYLKIYENRSATVTNVSSSVKPDANIFVTLDKEISGVAGAVSLTTSAGAPVSASVTASGTTVTIDPTNDLTVGQTYKVVIDEAVLRSLTYELTNDTNVFNVKATNYVVDIDFGAGDIGSAYIQKSGCTCTLTTEDIGGGNYALVYHDLQHGVGTEEVGDLVFFPVGGDTGIPYEEGKDIVIKTRFKGTSPDSALLLKLNLGEIDKYEYWLRYLTAFGLQSNGLFWGNNVWSVDGTTTLSAAPHNDKWFTAEIVIKGTTNTADITITEDGTDGVAKKVGMALNQDQIASTTHLKNIAFRNYSDPKQDNVVYIDYVQVYEERETSVSGVPTKVNVSANIPVTFASADARFANAVELYNNLGNSVIPSAKSYDDITKTVTINPNADLTAGTQYTVKIDKSKLLNYGYKLTGADTFTLIASNYLVEEDFSASTPLGWELVSVGGTTKASQSTIDVGGGNYALKVASDQSTNILTTYKINGDTGINFEEGKNVVIETRIKNNLTTGGIAFKIPDSAGWSNSDMYNGQGGVASITEGVGILSGIYPMYNSSKTVNTTLGNGLAEGWSSNQLWYTIKVEYKGTTGLANVTITDENGKSYNHTDIPVPFTHHSNQSTPYYVAGTPLKEVGYRGITSNFQGYNITGDFLIDYLKVYKVEPAVEIDITAVSEKVTTDGNITVTFDKSNNNLKNAVSFKTIDGATVPASITGTGTTVTINPDANLTQGVYYKVEIDKTVLEGLKFAYDGPTTFTVKATDYIVDEDYSDGNVGGWTAVAGTLGTGVVEGNNYAMTLSANNASLQGTFPVNGGEGIAFEDGKNVVIETKFKHTGTTPAFFKMNVETFGGLELFYNANTLVGIVEGSGILAGEVQYLNNVMQTNTSFGNGQATNWASEGEWFEVKVELLGTTGKGNVYITGENGQTISYLNQIVPINQWTTATNSNYTHLKSLNIRGRNGDSNTVTDTISIDYLRVYQVKSVDVTATVAGKVKVGESIVVYFDVDTPNADKAITLKDESGETVEATIEMSGTKAVRITPKDGFVHGKYYTVILNEETLEKSGFKLTNESNEFRVKATTHIVDEDFDATAPNGWVAISQSASAITSATISTEEVETGNYALKLAGSSTDIAMKYLINSGNGITLSSDKNLVIETKYKHTATSGHADFKINIPTTVTDGNHIASNSNERWNWFFTAVGLSESKGIHAGIKNYDSDVVVDTTLGTSFANAWYTVRIEYKGTTGRADLTVTAPDGKQLKYTDIPVPFNDYSSNSTPSVTTTLNNVGFRSKGSSSPVTSDNIYVDYLRIYETTEISASVSSEAEVAEDIKVIFTQDKAGLENAVTLKDYNGNTIEDVVKTYNNKVVTINPAADLVKDKTYKVVIDKDAVSALGYKLTGENEFEFVTYKAPNYVVREEYGADDVGNWTFNENGTSCGMTTEDLGGGNYALRYRDVYHGNWTAEKNDYAINVFGENGIPYEDGKNIVIQLRTKHTSSSAKYSVKFNFSGETKNEAAWVEHALFNFAPSAFDFGMQYGGTDNSGDFASTSTANEWYTAEIVIKGTTNKADITVTKESTSEVQAITDFDLTTGANATNIDKTALRNLALRSITGDDNIYVDYLRIYEEKFVSAKVAKEISADEDIKVGFTFAEEDFKNAVVLKDSTGAVIENVVKSYDSATKTVSVKPETDFVNGKTYKVVIDKEVIENLGYAYTGETEFDVTAYVYLVNNQFGATKPAEWSVVQISGRASSATDSTVDLGGGNYALQITGSGTYIAESLALAEPVTFSAGKNVIIKTKIRHSNTSGAVAFNLPDASGGWSGSDIFNGLSEAVTLVEGSGIRFGNINRVSSDVTYDTTLGTAFANGWYELEIEFIGATGRANVTVTDANGNKVTRNNIVIPANVYNAASTAYFTDANNLTTLGFRLLNSNQQGTSVSGDIQIDYFTIRELKYLSANVPATVVKDQTELKLSFNFDVDGAENLVKLYQADGETLIATTNTYDKDAKTVTLTANANFTEGTTYVVKIDKDALASKGFNTDGVETSYTVTGSKYVLNDTFDNGLDGWVLYNEKGQLSANDGFMNLTMTGENDTTRRHKQIAIKRFSSPIEHKDGKYTVVETRIKNTTGTVNTLFKVNINPEVVDGTWEQERNNYTLFGLGKNYTEGTSGPQNYSFLYPKGKAVNAYGNVLIQRMWDVAPDTINGTWFTVKARFDGDTPYAVELTVTNETTGATSTVTADMRTWDDEGQVTDADYSVLKNFAVRMSSAGTGVTETAVVDYVKVSYEDKETTDTSSYGVKIYEVGDETKTPVTVLERGKTYTAYFSANVKDSAKVQDIAMIMAVYSGDQLIELNIDEYIARQHNNRITATFTVPADSEKDYRIKAFLWDKVTSYGADFGLTPLADYAEAKINKTTMSVYVAPNGSDSNNGLSNREAVATLGKAMTIVATAKNLGYKKAEVVMAGGTYNIGDNHSTNDNIYISKFSMGKENAVDSLVIKAKDKNNKPVLTGGRSFTLGDATKVTDTAILNRLNHLSNASTVKANLYVYDLVPNIFEQISAETGKNALGGLNLPGFASYYEGQTFTDKDGEILKVTETKTPAVELFYNGNALTLARYPNSGYLPVSDVTDAGAKPYFWRDETVPELLVPEEDRDIVPMTITNSRASNWSKANQAHVYGYWQYNWASQAIPVASISGNNIVTKYPSAYGVDSQLRTQGYYVYNLLEEIDQPGEYFIDRTNGKLYFYAPSGATANSKFTVSFKGEALMTIYASAKNVTIDSVDFNISRDSAISIYGDGTENITIKNCDIANTAEVAIDSLVKNVTIENNTIHDVNGGVRITAGNTTTLEKGNNIVKNNKFERFSRLDKTYTPAVRLGGVGNTVTANEMSDAEHAAIIYAGVDNVISYNNIHDVLKEADDSSAIYTYGSWVNRDNKIHNNFIHDLQPEVEHREGVAAVYIDGYSADADIQNNVFMNIKGRGVWDNRGNHNVVNNNLFINCFLDNTSCGIISAKNTFAYDKYANIYTGLYNGVSEKATTDEGEKTAFALRFASELYEADGTTPKQDLWKRYGLVFTNNLFVNSGNNYDETFISNAESDAVVSGNYYETSGSASNYVTTSSKGITVNNSAVKAKVPGFADINFVKMGVQ